MADRLTFINLPVADIAATTAFFGQLGFEFNPKFSDQSTACMVISDKSYVMLMERDRFEGFTAKPLGDPAAVTSGIVCVSADDRAGVDAFADAALAAGGATALPPTDYGFMYGRSFYDLDGYHWEVMWMDPAAVEQGPSEYVSAQNA